MKAFLRRNALLLIAVLIIEAITVLMYFCVKAIDSSRIKYLASLSEKEVRIPIAPDPSFDVEQWDGAMAFIAFEDKERSYEIRAYAPSNYETDSYKFMDNQIVVTWKAAEYDPYSAHIKPLIWIFALPLIVGLFISEVSSAKKKSK